MESKRLAEIVAYLIEERVRDVVTQEQMDMILDFLIRFYRDDPDARIISGTRRAAGE